MTTDKSAEALPIEALASYLPDGVMWGERVNPAMVAHIIDRTALAAAQPAPATEPATVPWPAVTRYSGGASREGVAGRVWIKLDDTGREVEYVPAPVRVQTVAEPLVRFCPGCGRVGEVGAQYRDCCPDGSRARMIPEALAGHCHDLFQLAIQHAAPTAADAVAPPWWHCDTHGPGNVRAWGCPECVREMRAELRKSADAVAQERERLLALANARASHEASAAAHHAGKLQPAHEWHLTRHAAMRDLIGALK